VRWLVPSVTDCLFVAVLTMLLFTPLSVRLLGDAGIGWHIRTGQLILATHAIPRMDPFSSTMAGKPWFAWEWLYDVAAGKLESALGLNGVVWFTALVIAAVFAGTFRWLTRRGANFAVALVLVLLALAASTIHFLARPHVLSWLFTLIWFAVLDCSEREGLGAQRKLWSLPLLMLLWVNVHGGFLAGFVLLGIFWVAAAWKWFSTTDTRIGDSLEKIGARQQTLHLTLAGVGTVAASLINPYGWNLYAHVYSYLSDRFLMDHIDEFQSPNFHGVAQRCFAVLFLIAVATIAVRGRELRLSGLLTVLFAMYAGLYASRSIPLSSILLVMVVGPLMGRKESRFAQFTAGKRTESFLERMTEIELQLRAHAWPLAAIAITLLIAANGGRVGSEAVMNAHFSPQRMPVAAVNFVVEKALHGPVLSPDYWGGYLIYRLYPKQQVVVDDRHDLYGSKFFKSYLKMIRVEPGWDEFLGEHPAGCVVLPREAALTTVLLGDRDWKAIYTDGVAVVFVPVK